MTTMQLSARITIDELAKELGLPSWEDLDERNLDYYHSCVDPEERDEDERMRQADAARDELYERWYGAVYLAASALYSAHGLDLIDVRAHPSYEMRIVPEISWADAAAKLLETINGVGYFHFGSLGEFLRSGPYTARQAVLAHRAYIRRYPEVYGTSSARRAYELAID